MSAHSFQRPRDPKFTDEMQTISCPRCGYKLVFDCKTKRTVPADIFERAPEIADCDAMLVGAVMET